METSIHFREYKSDSDSSKTLILFHDIGGGHDTFKDLIPLLISSGLNVVVFDYLGHGLSSGTRGHFESVAQIKMFLTQLYDVSDLAKGSDVYTLSLNQGALIALYYSSLFDNIKGNIFINPRLKIELANDVQNEILGIIPLKLSKFDSKFHLKLRKQSTDLTANGFITKQTLLVLQKLLKKVQLDVYFMNNRNLIFSSGRESIIFETLMSDFRDEVEIPDFNSIKNIKKEDIIFKETYNWLYEN